MKNKKKFEDCLISYPREKSAYDYDNNKNLKILDKTIDFVREVEKLNNFTGEFDVHTIYERSYLGKPLDVYGLIHTNHEVFLEDKPGETEEEKYLRLHDLLKDYNEEFNKEAALLYDALKRSDLELDYFFIMPYFNVWNKDKTKKNSYLLDTSCIGRSNAHKDEFGC